ncbi:Pre-mRNA-splicing factor SYF2 [Apodemus speciosus]|uniref:Pre-mRNA-splicing factor SYF2 n=1 Tax=Apodemus speciosus TaxID=105296 RepID=A0ABQ0EPW0_APOSI
MAAVTDVVVPADGAEARPLAAEELAAQKREQRLRKFRELHLKRNEARKLNHQEVVEEDKRLKLPANWEAKKARLEWELQEEEKKKECAARGEDYEKVKLLEISAEDAERWERRRKKKNPDLGFSDYAAAQLRQYHRLTKQIKPDMESYERQREKQASLCSPGTNSVDQAGLDLRNPPASASQSAGIKASPGSPEIACLILLSAGIKGVCHCARHQRCVPLCPASKVGEDFFPTSNSLLHGTHVPSSEEIDRMVLDLEKQIEKRDKYSRRRPYNDDADIDYINERNAKFNKKAERFYGKYTAEIKQNLERGTAV